MIRKIKHLFISFVAILTVFLISVPAAKAETYTYDELNRIESVTYDNGQKIEYTYDAVGNVIAVTRTGGTAQEDEPGDTDEETGVTDESNDGDQETSDDTSADTDGVNEDENLAKDEQDLTEASEDEETEVAKGVTSAGEKSKGTDQVAQGESEQAIGAASDEELPSTATSIYNYLLAGAILVAVSSVILIYRKRKNA